MHFRIFVIFIFLLTFQTKSSSAEENAAEKHIFSLIYNQQFSEAEKLLQTEQNQLNPFYARILDLDLHWWKYSLSRSKEDANQLKIILDNFSTETQNTQEERINELIRSSYKMRYEIKRYNFISALFIRSDVRKQIALLKSKPLNINTEQLKLFDLYLVLFQYFDNVINPFSIESKSAKHEKSLSLLEKYAQDDDLILSTMAHYFLGRILIKVENKPLEGEAHFKILANRFPKNTLFRDIANGTNTKF